MIRVIFHIKVCVVRFQCLELASIHACTHASPATAPTHLALRSPSPHLFPQHTHLDGHGFVGLHIDSIFDLAKAAFAQSLAYLVLAHSLGHDDDEDRMEGGRERPLLQAARQGGPVGLVGKVKKLALCGRPYAASRKVARQRDVIIGMAYAGGRREGELDQVRTTP